VGRALRARQIAGVGREKAQKAQKSEDGVLSQRSRSADTEDGRRRADGLTERIPPSDRPRYASCATDRMRILQDSNRVKTETIPISDRPRSSSCAHKPDEDFTGDGSVRWAVRSAGGWLCEARFGSR
jgi:hypothetical protein